MKLIFIAFALIYTLTNASAQKTELKGSLNSGLFAFSGVSAQANTNINYDDLTKSGYTNNPYGSDVGLSYGLSLNIKRITRCNFIFGLDIGYEDLRSKILIDQIDGFNGSSTYQNNATGQTYLNNYFLNLYPFVGYRLISHKVFLRHYIRF